MFENFSTYIFDDVSFIDDAGQYRIGKRLFAHAILSRMRFIEIAAAFAAINYRDAENAGRSPSC